MLSVVSNNAFVFKEHLDGRWLCVNLHVSKYLSDFLADYGFDIPESITYCLAENDKYSLKYRVYGGTITCYIKDLVTDRYL